MRVIAFDNLGAFAQRVTPLLLEREAENCFLLGRIAELSRRAGGTPSTHDGPHQTWAVEAADGRVVAAAMTGSRAGSVRAPPLVVSRAAPEVVAALVPYFLSRHGDLAGVSAPDPTADWFADAWCAANGKRQRLMHGLGLFQLTRLIPPRTPGGTFRPATPDDAGLLVRWADAFFRDVGEPESIEFCEKVVAERVAEGRLFLWCDPDPVSMSGWAGRTPNGVRINFVYTPPEHRGRGYASASVAALSQRLLDSGRRFCTLFTDLANPTSNHIYRAIGYQHVCDFKHISFV